MCLETPNVARMKRSIQHTPYDEYSHQMAVASVLDRRIDVGAGSVTRSATWGSPSLAARTVAVGSESGRPADRRQVAASSAGSYGAAECYSPERYEETIHGGFGRAVAIEAVENNQSLLENNQSLLNLS